MFRKHKEDPPLSDLQQLEREYVAVKEVYQRSRDPRSKEKFVAMRDRLIAARNDDRQYRVAVQAGERKP